MLTEPLLRIVFFYCFGKCRDFTYNIFWDSDVFFDSQNKTFKVAKNLYAMLRSLSGGMYHIVDQLWENRRGMPCAWGMVLARHEIGRYFHPVATIISEYFNQASLHQGNLFNQPISKYEMTGIKALMEDENKVFPHFDSTAELESFLSGFNNDMLYGVLTCLFEQLLRFDDLASIEASNHVGMLMINAFFRDESGDYCASGLRNSDASVRFIFGVLKRLFNEDRLLDAWTWTQLLPLLFEYAPHVQHWEDMHGFKMFRYMMHRDHARWEICSHCMYYAAAEMADDVVVIFMDSNEVGELLTTMLGMVAPIWKDRTGILLSFSRLLAAWRLQHPDLTPPATLNLARVVDSPCSLPSMQVHVLPHPLAIPLGQGALLQDPSGYVYGPSPELIGTPHLTDIEAGLWTILHSEDCVQTPEFHLQVFNSFVMWLLSRFPAIQLAEHAEAIIDRMGVWECATECGSGQDPSYITDLRRKLHVSANLTRKRKEM